MGGSVSRPGLARAPNNHRPPPPRPRATQQRPAPDTHPPCGDLLPQVLRILSVVNALGALLMLVLLGLAVSTSHQFVEVHRWKEEAWALANEALEQEHVITDLSRHFVQFGHVVSYHDFWDLLRSGARERTLERHKALGLTRDEQALVEQAYRGIDRLAVAGEIAMKLTIQAHGHDWDHYPEVHNLTWDLEAEPDREWQRLQFFKRRMWYTNATHDMALPGVQQVRRLQTGLGLATEQGEGEGRSPPPPAFLRAPVKKFLKGNVKFCKGKIFLDHFLGHKPSYLRTPLPAPPSPVCLPRPQFAQDPAQSAAAHTRRTARGRALLEEKGTSKSCTSDHPHVHRTAVLRAARIAPVLSLNGGGHLVRDKACGLRGTVPWLIFSSIPRPGLSLDGTLLQLTWERSDEH